VGRRDLELLRWGRHFRLSGGAKAVVGRTQRENEALAGLAAPADLRLTVEDHPGPLVLVIGQAGDRELQEAAGLAAAYSDAPLGAAVRVSVEDPGPVAVLHLDTPAKEHFKDLLI
jgi:predicted ribosome quality control (RQC) complex YloA/Tae2 family protein